MSFIELFVAAVVLVPALGLAAWVWLAMDSANDDLRNFVGFEGMHFDD
jgi:hypothetical protein